MEDEYQDIRTIDFSRATNMLRQTIVQPGKAYGLTEVYQCAKRVCQLLKSLLGIISVMLRGPSSNPTYFVPCDRSGH